MLASYGHNIFLRLTLSLVDCVPGPYLLQYGLPLLGISHCGQLHVSHLLHLLIHIDLLLQFADLGSQQSHRVLPVVLSSQSSGTCRVDGRDPVLQLRLA